MYIANWDSIKTHQVPDWYHNGKLGIFIHWGLYSIPAYAPVTWELGEVEADENWFSNNPYAEWYYNSIGIKKGPSYDYHIKKYGEEFAYSDFADQWKAENFDPSEWADIFQKAGAKYVVLTTKHHDGFCLYDSKYTDYTSAKRGPKKDLFGDLTDAVREKGLKMGAYYSGIIDWSVYFEPITDNHFLKDQVPQTFAYADYAYNQVMELIDAYHPSVLWNDIGWPVHGEHMLPSLFAHYYNTVEDGVVDDRWNGLWHDFVSKEYQLGEISREAKWEMCRGMGLSFGYNEMESEKDLLTTNALIAMLADTVSNNGNLLINIGPKADGTIPGSQVERLLKLGKWMEINGDSIYNTTCSKLANYKREDISHCFTKGEQKEYAIISSLKEGRNVIYLPNVFLKGSAMDSRVHYTIEDEGEYAKIQIENYCEEFGSVVFRE